MNTIPMIYVLPITGPNKDRGRICYVCHLGSASVIAAFIRQDSPKLKDHVMDVQQLFNKHPELQAFIVIINGPNEERKRSLIEFSEEMKLTVPITVLDPEVGLPDNVPINPDAQATYLLYRGRHAEKIVEILEDAQIGEPEFTDSYELQNTDMSFGNAQVKMQVHAKSHMKAGDQTISVFDELDNAAAQMIARP